MPNLSPFKHDPVLLALGEAIRRARLAKKLSQEQLALSADVDRSHLGRIERAENEITMLLLKRIANALDMAASQLLKDAGL